MLSKIKAYGNADFNYIWGKSTVYSDKDIEDLNAKGIHSPVWDSATVTLSTFSKDINASSYPTDTNIIGYKVQKVAKNSLQTINVAPETEALHIYDYNIQSGKTYKYRVIPIFNNNGKRSYGEVVETNEITIAAERWSIVSLIPTSQKGFYKVDTDNVWTFMLNVEEGAVKFNNNISFSAGVSRFPIAHDSALDYLSGSITALIGDIDCQYSYLNDDIYMIEKWRKFCKNGYLKLLKTPKGLNIPCEIHDSTATVDYPTENQPTSISFNFTQLCDDKTISAYSEQYIDW